MYLQNSYWVRCAECGNKSKNVVDLAGKYVCQSCLERALAMVKGEDNGNG